MPLKRISFGHRLKKYRLWLVILGVLTVGGLVGYQGYKFKRQSTLLKKARLYISKAQTRNATLVLKRALGYSPKDVAACRLMGDVSEMDRSAATLLWRSRVVEYNPGSVADRLVLARSALAFRDYATATNALNGVAPADQKTVEYHNTAGAVAAALNRPAEAEAHFLAAARQQPDNEILQLNLAVTRLSQTNQAQAAEEARRSLERISLNRTNSTLRCQALRELIGDSLNRSQIPRGLRLSQQLLLETNSVFSDRILQLSLLRATTNAELKSTLASYRLEAAQEPAKIYELGKWQLVNTTPGETLTWLRTLPIGFQTNQPGALLIAECVTELADWPTLQAFVEPQNWAELDFIRRAYMVRVLKEQNLGGAAKGEWEAAVKAAENRKESLVTLLRLAVAWKWPSEAEDILWIFVKQSPDERWAFNALNRILAAAGKTRPLMTLSLQELKWTPADLNLKNNLAATALLLNAKEHNPSELAHAIYQKVPTNSSYATTYAFSLYLKGKHAEALAIMNRIKPADLQEGSNAGYYGLVLKASGQREQAKEYLLRASRGGVLPEERILFDRALASN